MTEELQTVAGSIEHHATRQLKIVHNAARAWQMSMINDPCSSPMDSWIRKVATYYVESHASPSIFVF